MVTFAIKTPATALDRVQLSNPSLDPVRLSNGVTLNVATQGPAGGSAIIMLHGLSDSWYSFSRVMPLFPADRRIVVPDLRGHGHSDRPLNGYRVADMADDVIRLMDALQIAKAAVVGHSMGSFVARKVCELAPERVWRLILAGAGPRGNTPIMHELLQAVAPLTDPIDETFVRDFQLSCVNVPLPQEFMEAVVANSRRMPVRVWKDALQGLIDEDIRLVRPKMRTLVVGGRQDSVFSATEQMVLARQFPQGELHLVEGVGHTLHWEQPATFVNALKRFGL